jgi:hypothetical protein
LRNDTTLSAYYIFSSIDEISKKDDVFNDKGELRINQLISKYYRLDVEGDERQHPIAIYPPYLDERMAAQQSCFTLFGNIFEGLNPKQGSEDFLNSITIPAKNKVQILEEMRILGFSDFSIYPDLDGLGNSINAEYKSRFGAEQTNEGFQLLMSHFNSEDNDTSAPKDDQVNPI